MMYLLYLHPIFWGDEMRAEPKKIFAFFSLLVSFQGHATAQEDAKALSERATEELKLLVAFHTLERSATSKGCLLTYGIVPSTGGWKVFNLMEGSDYTNFFMMVSLPEEMQLDAVRAKAIIERSSVLTIEDKKNAAAYVAGIKTCTSAAASD